MLVEIYPHLPSLFFYVRFSEATEYIQFCKRHFELIIHVFKCPGKSEIFGVTIKMTPNYVSKETQQILRPFSIYVMKEYHGDSLTYLGFF